MKTNLLARFSIILAAIALALFGIFSYGLKGGIDLSGGTVLIYQLNIPKGYHGNPNQLARQVITTLRRRVDPKNVRNLVWRVLSGERIEIQMPLASAQSRIAQTRYQKLVDALMRDNIQPSQVAAALRAKPQKRAQEILGLAGKNHQRLLLLHQLSAAYDALAAANKAQAQYANNPLAMPPALIAQRLKASQTYQKYLSAVLHSNIDLQHLANLLSATYQTHNAAAEKALQKAIASHPGRAALLKKLVLAYAARRKHSGGLENPAELERLLRGAGVLDFQITVSPQNPAVPKALAQLTLKGPHSGFTPPGTRWYPIDRTNGESLLHDSGYVTGQWEGRNYILLYDTQARALTHNSTRRPWKVNYANLTSDPQTGGLVVAFNLDPIGAVYMRQLTSGNIHRDMAILMDGKAIEAPRIQSAIGGSGEITLGRASTAQAARRLQQQGKMLAQILNAGSLPATLQRHPISVQTIGATLGADNLRAGLHSAVIAVIVVLVFMFIYYTITGAFADVALILNLILLLGVMSMIHATFTLPGIAGVVLTLGMAVDANILINERIREELHKGASLWLAVKQGYDKVFWTIFDANTTTSLTSIVLIWLGSEDVKGFGVTLLIGLAVHMFTALFVTRTLMIAAIRFGVMKKIDDLSVKEYFRDMLTFTWLRGRWPFMRVFTLTNFDWIGKRRIFWVVSGIIMIAGLTAFFLRGNKKYDTEFNGGTQITLRLEQGKTMKVSEVRGKILQLAAQVPGLKALRHATVYSVGTHHNEFQIITSIVNPTAKPGSKASTKPAGKTTAGPAPVQLLATKLEAAFANVIAVKRRLSFTNVNVPPSRIQDLLDNRTVIPITHNDLQELIASMPNVDISDYHGGVAVVLRHIRPPATASSLTRRIRDMSQEPDFAALEYRPFKVIPIRYAPGAALGHGHAPVTEAVVVAADPHFVYNAYNASSLASWKQRVAGAEWHIIRTALTTSGGLAGITSFAPQVATEARLNALMAVAISLVLIVAYVWIRFGGIRYGFGVVFSLVHDAIVAVAGTVLAVYIHATFIGRFLLVSDFKINMTMIAAYLTVIGYSVNDTIVIFDRVRENRGRLKSALTQKLVNDSINQCFGRTIWTTFTVFVVVAILYVFGGQGVHGFAYAMLIGVFTGAYSTLAIASPMLLHIKDPPSKPVAYPGMPDAKSPQAPALTTSQQPPSA
jgi:SecD/SecF fusion protein